MAKLTLLQLVQDAMDAIDAEEVSDVEETAESSMVVNICNRSYEELMAKHRWRHLRKYSELLGSTNLNDLKLPLNTTAFDPLNLWYGTNGNEARVQWLEPDAFLEITIRRNTDDSDTQKIDGLKVYNDRAPRFFTSDTDSILRFDSMPTTGGLVAANSFGLIWQHSGDRLSQNAEVFDLPEIAFPALSSLIISKAINEIKGDSQGGRIENRNFKTLISALARNARVIDKADDIFKHVVPRRTITRSAPRIVR